MLLGGGFALADATKKSGLSQYLVNQLDGLKVMLFVHVFEGSSFHFFLSSISEPSTTVGELHNCSWDHNGYRGSLQHCNCKHPGAYLVPDVQVSLHEPPIPHADCCHHLQLCLHATSGHGTQCYCVRGQHHEDSGHDDSGHRHEHYLCLHYLVS